MRYADETKALFARSESARYLGVTPRKIDELILERRLPATRIGKRVFIPRVALERYIDALVASAGLDRSEAC